ncbi:Homoserine kinase [Methylibium sp. T29-B]|nr:Homoserine kinase [Methylibium sp. T29-B]
MAVFTEVGFDEAAALAHKVGLGPLKALKPIKAGIENTNYFLTAERGEYVLTLFERLSAEQLPFYLHLMKHLAGRDILVPMPQSDAHGEILHALCGKPAAIVERLRGGHVLAPSAAHCQQVGAMLARMHEAGRDYPYHQPNLRGLAWWDETVPQILPFLAPPQRALLEDELAFQHSVSASASDAALPRGPIHADLFRDNVMFDEDAEGRSQLTGFFDFYFAGVDRLAFDIAVCLNDWCIDLASGRLLEDRAAAFVTAYARCAHSPATNCACCPRCCAPRRCASGSRGCGTCTSRARPACWCRTTPPTSSACCASASRRPGIPRAAEPPDR